MSESFVCYARSFSLLSLLPVLAPVQAFCEKAKLTTLRAEKAKEVDDEFIMVSNKKVTVKEVPVTSMEHMDPFKAPLVVISAKVGIYRSANITSSPGHTILQI